MIQNLSTFQTKNILAKYNLVGLKKKISEIKSTSISNLDENVALVSDFSRTKPRPDVELLKKEENELFDAFDFKYPLGFFAGCNSFVFRVTFKEYKAGLKAAKYSLLLNQFNLNLEKFINLVQEVLVNNFPLNFYEQFFGEDINDIDFKIHFLVILRTKGVNITTTKFFVVPKGCFISHLKEILWPTLFIDSLFLYSILTYYKGFKSYVGLIFVLIVFYLYKLLHHKLSLVINKHKIYNYEERAFESFGNILSLKFISYKLYCKTHLKIPRYSYLLSSRCIDFFIHESFEENVIFLDKKKPFLLDFYFDLLTIDEDLSINNTPVIEE